MQSSQAVQGMAPLLRGFATHAPALVNSGGIFSALGFGTRPKVPLSESLMVVSPTPSPLTVTPKLESSVLESGLKITTIENSTPKSALTLLVPGGTSAETAQYYGVNRVLEAMSFRATANRTTFRLTRELEKIGATAHCQVTREHLLYTVQFPKTHAAEATEILTDSVLNAKMNLWEVNEFSTFAAQQISKALKDPAVVIDDILHHAAYNGPLGNPLFSDPSYLKGITPDKLITYLSETVTPASMVLSGAGVKHGIIKSLAGELVPSGPSVAYKSTPSSYAGGSMNMMAAIPTTHFGLAFEIQGGLSDIKASATADVLKAILDESRTPLPRMRKAFGVLKGTSSFASLYNGTGLVGVRASSAPENTAAMVDAVSKKVEGVAKAVSAEQLAVAKGVVLGEYISQVSEAQGCTAKIASQEFARVSVDEAAYISAVESVSAADVSKLMQKALKSKLSFASYGALSHLPRYEDVAKRFA